MAASPQAVEIANDQPALTQPAVPLLVDTPVVPSSIRIPALDGLRGVAILLVLLYHAVFQFQAGSPFLASLLVAGRLTWSGVDLFFVLSGFLIGGILLDVRESPRYFSTFYIRRAYRILPLYGVVLALFSLRFVHQAAGPLGNFSPSAVPWIAYVTFTQNIWMGVLGTFGAGAMAATWSLAVEEQFYLTIPIVIKKIARSYLVLVLVLVVILAPLLRTALYLFFKQGSFAAYVLMPCRADSLCMGVLCALTVRTPRCWESLLAHRPRLYWATGLLFLGLLALTHRGYELSSWMVTIGYSWVELFYSACLLIALTAKGGLAERVLCNRFFMQLGMLAYCIYLLHLPLIEASRRLLGLHWNYDSTMTQFLGGLMGVVLTIVIARFSWTLFEKPLLRRGHAYKY